tara:strand:- start:7404 stop:8801 length:1398 start_codon:yes stop_codon:yes gene_type:complete
MSVVIEQRPIYSHAPVGQELIFSISQSSIVANNFKVKFIAEVHISSNPIVPGAAVSLVGTFKTTPNNAGVGIFNLTPVLETHLKPDNEGSKILTGSTYKGSTKPTHPIHLIDKISCSDNSIKYFQVRFMIEYATSLTGPIIPPTDPTNNNDTDSKVFTIFNGVIQPDDVLDVFGNNFGYDMSDYYLNGTGKSFLTTASTTQYARVNDYGTVPFFNYVANNVPAVYKFIVTYTFPSGSSQETIYQNTANGGSSANTGDSNIKLMYAGLFPGNLKNWSTTFATAVSLGLTNYRIRAYNVSGGIISPTLTFNILCDKVKGYESIRLTWLNQWGTWDYYTFQMKSIKSIGTRKTPYTQMTGTWNEKAYRIAGYKGGKKNFRVNTTETIKINTDFVSEEEGVWFEQLINSTEVYVLEGYQTDSAFSSLNNYVQPATLKTSSYTRKTIANDRLMQYTFEIEKSKLKRTQAV